MAEVKNSFIKSKMNKDLDSRLLPNGEYREGINIQVSKSEGADVGALENVLGNNLIFDFKSASGCECALSAISMYTDNINDNIYVFLTDYDETETVTDNSRINSNYISSKINYSTSAKNYIYQYNRTSNSSIMLVEGAFLNFSKNKHIDSINLIEGILFWTDNRNQPRRIVVDSCLTGSPTASISNGFYTTEDQISVASYSPFQPIHLYYKKTQAYNTNGGQGVTSIETAIPATGSTTVITLKAGLIQGVNPSLLIGAIVTAVDSSGTVVGGIPAGTTLTSYNAGELKITISSLITIALPIDTIIYLNQNLQKDEYLTSMLDVNSPLNPSGGLANPNYNPNYSGDPDFLEDKFVKFSYRFKYDDGTYSVMAPFTQGAFIPKQDGYFLADDEEETYRSTVVNFMENKVNNIFLQIPTPLDINNNPINAEDLYNKLKVTDIEILYKESDSLAVMVIDSLTYNTSSIVNYVSSSLDDNGSSTGVIIYNYQATKPYKTLPESELIRVYDKAPVRANTQEIISNRLVYGNFQDKHTPPESFDYNVVVSNKYTNFAIDTSNNDVLQPVERTSSREYPMHTVKQNRNYQVGIVLSDKFGRTSSTILSSANTQTVNEEGLILLGDTVYFPYNTIDTTGITNNINSWPGDSIKVLFNKKILGGGDLTESNLNQLTPGAYNGDSTSVGYNPLGWYSYKIVVKQQEQDYYNVYLPGILNGYPEKVITPPDPVNTINLLTLLNDNINKVPRDLTEVGPEQKQFRSGVELSGRVTPDTTSTQPSFNLQYNPGVVTNTVSTISEQDPLLQSKALADQNNVESYVEIYQTTSNPSIARTIQTEGVSNPIGSLPKTNAQTDYNIILGIYETAPEESLLDIYWETTSSGTIAELNLAIDSNNTSVAGFTTNTDPAAAPDEWTFNLYENILPGQSPNQLFNGTYGDVDRQFFPYTTDAGGSKTIIYNSEIQGAVDEAYSVDVNNARERQNGFTAIDGKGDDVSSKFWLIKNENNAATTPDKYYIKIRSSIFFCYTNESIQTDVYTFNFIVTNKDSSSNEKTSVAASGQLFNIIPIIENLPANGFINVTPGSTTIIELSGKNGSANSGLNKEGLEFSIIQNKYNFQTVDGLATGLPPTLEIDQNGKVTDPTGSLNSSLEITVFLEDNGTNETTYNNIAKAETIIKLNGNTGFEVDSLNSTAGWVKNALINQGPESSGFFWANKSGNIIPLSVINQAEERGQGGTGAQVTDQAPIDDLEFGSPFTGIGFNGSPSNNGYNTLSIAWSLNNNPNNWFWTNTIRTVAAPSSSWTPNLKPRADTGSSGGEDVASINEGTAYIIVDFELLNYGGRAGDSGDFPAIAWPTFLQYRATSSDTWNDALDVEGRPIKFGGTQINDYENISRFGQATGPSTTPRQLFRPFDKRGVLNKKDEFSIESVPNWDGVDFNKTDAFESTYKGKNNEQNNFTDINSVGRKMFAIGKNQSYPGNSNIENKFGEYRLFVRYPFGSNVSTNPSGAINPALTKDKVPGSNSGEDNGYQVYENAQQNQRVYLNFGDFYNPTYLVNEYVNGIQSGQNIIPPQSFKYLISSTGSTSASQAASQAPTEVVWAREWSFKYVSQLYKGPELNEFYNPPNATETLYYSYQGAEEESPLGGGNILLINQNLNVEWGDEFSNNRFDEKMEPQGERGSGFIRQNDEIYSRRWYAQFTAGGKKVPYSDNSIGSVPCESKIGTPSSNITPTGETYGVMTLEKLTNTSLKVFFNSGSAGESDNNMLDFLLALTGSQSGGNGSLVNISNTASTTLQVFSGQSPFPSVIPEIKVGTFGNYSQITTANDGNNIFATLTNLVSMSSVNENLNNEMIWSGIV